MMIIIKSASYYRNIEQQQMKTFDKLFMFRDKRRR